MAEGHPTPGHTLRRGGWGFARAGAGSADLLMVILAKAHSIAIEDVEGRVGEDTRRHGRYHLDARRREDGRAFAGFGETLEAALEQLLTNLLAAPPRAPD